MLAITATDAAASLAIDEPGDPVAAMEGRA